MAKIGYARVSTKDQNLHLQIDALQKDGCEKVFEEKASGKNVARPELRSMLDYVRAGDIVVVYKLDRLGRSTKDLINLIEEFENKGVEFRSIQDAIDTTSATGKFFFTVISAFSQLERDMISERTKAGLEAAKARGRRGGRKEKMTAELKRYALQKTSEMSINEILDDINAMRSEGDKISKSTLCRGLADVREKERPLFQAPTKEIPEAEPEGPPIEQNLYEKLDALGAKDKRKKSKKAEVLDLLEESAGYATYDIDSVYYNEYDVTIAGAADLDIDSSFAAKAEFRFVAEVVPRNGKLELKDRVGVGEIKGIYLRGKKVNKSDDFKEPIGLALRKVLRPDNIEPQVESAVCGHSISAYAEQIWQKETAHQKAVYLSECIGISLNDSKELMKDPGTFEVSYKMVKKLQEILVQNKVLSSMHQQCRLIDEDDYTQTFAISKQNGPEKRLIVHVLETPANLLGNMIEMNFKK